MEEDKINSAFDKIKENNAQLPYISLPENWECTNSKGIGPFITHATLKNPEGKLFSWNSRYYRKYESKLNKSTGSTWWAPGAVAWWIGILFGIGASLFAIGSVPGYISLVGATYDSVTLFVGSIFFTSAAYLQYIESVNAPHNILDLIKEKFHFFTWEPQRIDWWATAVQFLGTIFFNISTGYAIYKLSISQIDSLVWYPDVYGSTCFLIASILACLEISRPFWSLKERNFSWWIATLNLIGSIAFGISAAYAYVLPTTGHPENGILVNLGTFIGAVCFLIGGLLLLPERTQDKNIN